ncbi:hypothetical protein IAG25_32600 [Caballeronia sp. EK]|uniref:hypothetical protein n=1 Tax=Caballeronia sp. EK TaxID=2767469 RepID=UPI0019BBC21A|nr:hypothetical protein [Caballeronia sp. EK]MBC8641565.1 hypothetical protein [Caballeronia sp. EK]
MQEWANRPVDEDLFLFCTNLYTAAARMTMPVENPEARPITIEGMGTFAFKDIPMNRGMMAVTKELIDQGVDEPTRTSMCWRVMNFGDVLNEGERFARWFRAGDRPGAVSVAEALIRAGAVAKIDFSKESATFDMDDVARHAAQIEARLESEANDGDASGDEQ